MRLSRVIGAQRMALYAAVLGGVLIGPVSGAAASDASIKAVIKSYDSKILTAEGHVLTALGAYKKSGNPSGAQAAIQKSIAVLSSLKSKIASQPASSNRVKLGKAKFEQGLQAVVVAYGHLKTALGEKKVSPQAAKAEAKKALLAVKAGSKELREGAKLLS
jgi:hypothetical protein